MDITGYWVSLVTQDWRLRMVVPGRGEYLNIPLNQRAKDFADAWSRQKEVAAGRACSAYGAPALMEVPGRLHISWADDLTLKVDTDAGEQTRLLHFAPAAAPGPMPGAPGGAGAAAGLLPGAPPPAGAAPAPPAGPPPPAPAGAPAFDMSGAAVARSWQGWSVAEWQIHGAQRSGLGIGLAGSENDVLGGPVDQHPPGSLKVRTSRLLAGVLRKNGLPYSEQASMLEYWDLQEDPVSGLKILALTSELTDPVYLRAPYVHNPIYVSEADGSKWDPSPCSLDQ